MIMMMMKKKKLVMKMIKLKMVVMMMAAWELAAWTPGRHCSWRIPKWISQQSMNWHAALSSTGARGLLTNDLLLIVSCCQSPCLTEWGSETFCVQVFLAISLLFLCVSLCFQIFQDDIRSAEMIRYEMIVFPWAHLGSSYQGDGECEAPSSRGSLVLSGRKWSGVWFRP